MLVIRAEQMQFLQAEMDRGFAERLARAIESCFPDYFKGIGGENVRGDATAVVAALIERAESLGIEQEKDIAAYALLEVAAVELGHTADAFLAWTQPIVTNEDIAGAAKIPLVQCRLEREAKLDARAARVLAMLRSMRGTD
jgi:hypothetical protein